jgi:HEAT repeat protein
LLTLLTQEKRDDVFRHRLALATRCLPELRLSSAKNLTDMVNRVTTAAFSFWSRHERQGTEATVPHFTRVFPALVQVNGSVEGTPLLQRLARQLQEKKEDVRIGAMRAVGLAGESVVQHPDILNAVAAALRDADEMVRAEAAAALKQIGKAATISPEVLVSLTQVVQHDSSWFVRSAAAQALRKLQGKGGAPTETDNFQTSALSEEDTGLTPIPHQLKNSGAQGGTSEDTLSQFTSLLFSEDPTARAHAAYALGQRKEQVAQYPETVSALVQVALHDQDSGVRGQALDALARIGKEAESALRGQACLALVHAVQQDKESGIRARAARALRAIVSREVPGVEVCSTLLPALGDPDVNVRAEVAAVLGEIMAHGVRLFRRWWRKVEVKNVEELSTV